MHSIPWRYLRQVESARDRRRRDPDWGLTVALTLCNAISEPKIKSRNITTTMTNVNAAPLEKRTKVELLLPAESAIRFLAQVDQFCDVKTETRKSVNPHNNCNLSGLQTVLSEKQTKPFGFLPATQDDRKWKFFMSDFEWTASTESICS